MSYEDSNCPCGEKKTPNDMLCDACMEHLNAHPSMAVFLNDSAPLPARRQAAIILLSLSRNRTRQNTVDHRPSGSGGSACSAG